MRTLTASALFALMLAGSAHAYGTELRLNGKDVVYQIDPGSLKVTATTGGDTLVLLPGTESVPASVSQVDGGYRWTDAKGRSISASIEADSLKLTITDAAVSSGNWVLAPAEAGDDWVVPDGEGVLFSATDPFWQKTYGDDECLGATSLLSFPAWSRLHKGHAVTYGLSDGLQSELCFHDAGGVQGRLRHDFGPGSETVELFLHVGSAEPLAPALFYRSLLVERGLLVRFADKPVAKLSRLYGAQHAYLWGEARNPEFLDGLKALGITRMLLAYDQNPVEDKHVAGKAFQAKADAMGYLAGPYEEFENAQTPGKADTPLADWGAALYPSGCIVGKDGKVVTGFAGRGCELSSEVLRDRTQAPSPRSRFAGHVADQASHVFLDVDAYGDFLADYSPDHPMSMARDRDNRLKRMKMAIADFGLVLGSENVTGWAHGVTHYSHGTAQAHVSPLWPLHRDKARFGGYWPAERPAIFFKAMTLTPEETRALFAVEDRVPLFEAVFHDALIATDRWEFGLMKVSGSERQRFARALLYGTPTMWVLDGPEFKRLSPWLKAAHADFKVAHGQEAPVALTGFAWLSDDKQVQQATYADGRTIVANFGATPWQGLKTDCVRVTRTGKAPVDLCAPATVPPPVVVKYKPK